MDKNALPGPYINNNNNITDKAVDVILSRGECLVAVH